MFSTGVGARKRVPYGERGGGVALYPTSHLFMS